ncbi:MAG: twin-arginine translocase TatA/TatE family subunit [Flavobacteriales bacterium]|jgi:sec-independent protein translocase protein TatA|nr:twin-arginine translocase TatA/TatE family subunit [Flavobacteriales bacterium]|tara:strand:- start:488 stop:688 length:201 start_codon:yes stop_codon:yes gene_type:complete
MLLFIGGAEIVIVLLFIIMFFGSKKIPEIARGIGKGIREVRDASNEIKKEIRESANSVNDDLDLEK